jgi:hypothetical protein
MEAEIAKERQNAESERLRVENASLQLDKANDKYDIQQAGVGSSGSRSRTGLRLFKFPAASWPRIARSVIDTLSSRSRCCDV